MTELEALLQTDRAPAALREVEAAQIESTRAVALIAPEALGDLRAVLARLALRAEELLTKALNWPRAPSNCRPN